MRNILIVLCTVWSVTSARPEAGYNYATPNRGFSSGGNVNFGGVNSGYATGSSSNFVQQPQQQIGFFASNSGSASAPAGYTGSGFSSGSTGFGNGFSASQQGFGSIGGFGGKTTKTRK